jgi:hypothetical protein
MSVLDEEDQMTQRVLEAGAVAMQGQQTQLTRKRHRREQVNTL